ncbi:MAG: autotransporter domain-containing protein [Hyphomicrobiales bacterium]
MALAALLASSPLLAQVQNGSVFNPEGPGPIIGNHDMVGSGDNPPNGTATGAFEAIAADPTNPNTIFAGAVNGGIWKTTNGGTSWTPLIDQMASISISSLAFDPTDATHKTLIAGTGDTSNGGFGTPSNFSTPANFGGLQNGLLYSANGGTTWTHIGAAALSGQSVVDVAARGSTILAATFEPRVVETGASLFTGALYRSTNGGATFSAVSGAGGTGLPAGPVTSLVGDPANPNTFYAAVTASSAGTKAQTAVYKSTDGGATWNAVFTSANSGGLITAGAQTSIKLASGPVGTVAVGLVDIGTGALTGLFYSSNSGGTWKTLTAPAVNPGGQAPVNIALAIDPTSTNLVYVEGDNNFNNNGGFNALNIMRVNATNNTATAMSDDLGVPTNTANGSFVHPDGRVLVFDSNGRLLTGTDGGLYARTNPQDASGVWQGLNGNIVATEVYAAGFDGNSKRVVTSQQDNGSSYQSAPANQTANEQGGGDGINVAINDTTLGNRSAIYVSSQFLGLQRVIVDQNGNVVSPASGLDFQTGITVNFNVPVSGVAFTSPLVLNNIDPTRMAVAGTSVYVTQDTLSGANGPGATTVNLTLTNLGATGNTITALDYGTRNNPNALIAGGGHAPAPTPGTMFLSTTAAAGSLTPLPAYAGLAPTSVKFDLRSDQRFFAADSVNLYGTVNQGASFQTLTSNLPANFIRPTALGFVDNNGVDALLVGGLNSADNAGNPLVVADSDATGNLSGWRRFGSGLPNTTIDALSYDVKADTLAVGTVGRGAFLIYDFTSNFASAAVLQFGLANNDSNPDPAILFGNRPLVKYGTGTLTINGPSTYTGTTSVLAGTMAAGAANVFAPTSAFSVSAGATLNLASFNQTIGSLTGAGGVSLGSAILTTGGDNSSTTFSGAISGAGGIVKAGAGIFALSGQNTYTGPTTVNGGTLQAGAVGALANASAYTLAGGASLDLAGFNQTIGSLAGTGNVTLGAATLTTGNDQTSTSFAGVISGTGGLAKIGNGTFTLTSASTYAGPTNVNAGTLDVNGSLVSAVIVNNGGTLMGNGTIGGLAVNGGGMVAPGNSIGTLNVSGNVAFAAGSTYQAEINAAGQGDKILATGQATLSGGTVQVLAANGAYTQANRYTILTANGGVTGTFANVTVNQNFAFLTPTLTYDANDAFFGFTLTTVPAGAPGAGQPIPFPSVAVTRNEAATAAAVQALGLGNAVYNAVVGQTVAGARQAFDALSGEIHASAATAAFEDARLPREAILDRLNQPAEPSTLGAAIPMTGAYAADLPSGKGPALAPVSVQMYQPHLFGLWGQGFGNWGHTSTDRNAASLKRDTGGFVAGADVTRSLWNGIFRLGLAGGYTNDSLSVKQRFSSGSFESVFGGLYGGASFGAIELRAGVLYGTNTTSTTRSIIFPNFADAAGSSYGGSTAQAFGELGYRIGLSGFNMSAIGFSRASLEPFIGGAAIHIHQNGFVEAGGAAALTGFGKSYDLATTTLGVRAETTLAGPWPITARALLGWRHAYGDVAPKALMAFQGGAQAFSIGGVPVDRDALVAEAGLDYAVSSMVTVGVSYSGQYGRRAIDNAFKGHLDVRFW